jgi:TonB-linked SusC/RagA family outer membrane protein
MKKNPIFHRVLKTRKFFLKLFLTGLALFVLSGSYEELFARSPGLLIADMQQLSVSGKITESQTNTAMPGVNVLIKGSTMGTISGSNGDFSITVPGRDAILIFSFIGYKSLEVPLSGRSIVNVVLEPDVTSLEEIIVVGYGTRERGVLTGSVANIDGSAINLAPAMNVTKSLTGKMPGLIISDRGGAPGSDYTNILIRGSHTLGDNSPLIVIDGVPGSTYDLGNMSAEDILDISVLKDAAAAIYGARAANGVIIVRTKRGEKGEPRIQYNGSYGLSSFTRYPDLMNGYEYTSYKNAVQERLGRQPLYSAETIEFFRTGTGDPRLYPQTDWMKVLFKDWAANTHHNLSVTSGTEKLQYYLSGDYQDESGQLTSNDVVYKRYQVRSNIDIQPLKYLNVGVDLLGRFENEHFPGSYGSAGSLFAIVQRADPTATAWYPNGLPAYSGEKGTTPIMLSSDKSGWSESLTKYFTSKFTIGLDLDWITQGLGITGYGFFSYQNGSGENLQRPYTLYSYNKETDSYTQMQGAQQGVGSNIIFSQNSSGSDGNLFNLMLRYERGFGNHKFDAFIAYEQSESSYKYLSAGRRNLYSDQMLELFAGEEDARTVNGYSSQSGRVNYFGNLSYNYMRKYILDFTLRRDGSFNFPEGKRFGTFPGVSVGWAISEEPFMDGAGGWLDNLKLRASYAKMGNDRIGSYQFLTQYKIGQYMIFGNPGQYAEGMYVATTPNPNITWEYSLNQNFGFDAMLLKGKLSLNVDYFYEKRRDILIRRSESVPAYTALELPMENLGKVDNQGFEILTNFQNKIGQVTYTLGGNFTYNHNEIIYMDEAAGILEHQKKEGHPMASWLIYEADGLFQTQDEVDKYPHISGAKPGDIKYVDITKDDVINNNDQIRKYSSPIPEIQYGIDLGARYKGFELSALFQGQANATTMIFYKDQGGYPAYMWYDRWTPENRDASVARPFDTGESLQRESTFNLYNAAFVRLKNVMLAYNVPSKLIFGKNLQVYIKGYNLWTIFDHMPFKNFDPEINSREAEYYPQLTTITGGLNIQF